MSIDVAQDLHQKDGPKVRSFQIGGQEFVYETITGDYGENEAAATAHFLEGFPGEVPGWAKALVWRVRPTVERSDGRKPSWRVYCRVAFLRDVALLDSVTSEEPMSIETTEAESAAVAKNQDGRIKLVDIEAYIAQRHDTTLDKALSTVSTEVSPQCRVMSICVLVLRNDFIVIGKSAPLDPENFDAELGKKFAYEDAVRACWPLLAFARAAAAVPAA